MPSPSPTPTPSITITTPNPSPTSPIPSPSPTYYFNQPANSAQLTQALLPPGVLGTAAIVSKYGTDLSSLVVICGGLIPSGAQLTAHEVIYDSQTEQTLEESIVEWDSSGDAATLIIDDHTALDQGSSCSFSVSAETIQWSGDDPGSAPQECGNSQYVATYVATQVSTQSPDSSGFQTVGQCGRYTITTAILDGNGSTATQEAADAYLDNSVARLQGAIG